MESYNDNTTIYYPDTIANKLSRGELTLCENTRGSRCWNVFAKIMDLNSIQIKGFVFCRSCHKVYRYKYSISNLVRHKCYIAKYFGRGKDKIPDETAISIIKVEDPQLEGEIVECPQNVHNNLTKLITKWIIRDCKLYGVLLGTGLREIFQEFISLGAKHSRDIGIGQILPSSIYIEKNVNVMYEKCSTRLMTEIDSIKDNGFGLTCDIWTDSYTERKFIALTIHYLKNGALTFCFLGIKLFYGTKKNIYDSVVKILADFNCALFNTSIIVTSAESEVLKALPNIKSIACISKLLKKALQNSIEDTPEVVELVSACLKLLKFLKEASPIDNFNNSLQNYCPSRWASMYDMFSFIASNWIEITSLVENQRIESVNINYLKAIAKTLQPFEVAIENLEDDNDATLHLVLIYLHELKKSCDKNDNDLYFIERLKENLKFHLETISTENITIFHKIALFLYPPTNKLLLFSDEEKNFIERECIRLCLEDEKELLIKPKLQSKPSHSMNKRNIFSDFIEPETNLNPEELIDEELQNYKRMRVNNSEDFDCFNWWETNKNNYPYLYKLNCWTLATPASISLTQQVFSVAGNLLEQIGSDLRLNEKEAEKIIFINFNGQQDELDTQE